MRPSSYHQQRFENTSRVTAIQVARWTNVAALACESRYYRNEKAHERACAIRHVGGSRPDHREIYA